MPIDLATIAFYLGALALIAAVHLVMVWERRPRVRFAPVAEGPRCQGCGYILYGEPPLICPECGRDALPDLLIRQSVYPPIKPVATALAGALLLFPIIVAAAFPIAALFPQTWRADGEKVIATPAGEFKLWVYARGRAWHRSVKDTMVFLPAGSKRDIATFDVERDAFVLRRGELVQANRAGVLELLGAKCGISADAGTVRAADEIVSELESLRNNRWPEDRFEVEMSGTYVLDPDDNGGPFFWLPKYAIACVPFWLVGSFVIARRLFRRHRAAVTRFESKYLEPLELMSRET
jgi:hypothetical protein